MKKKGKEIAFFLLLGGAAGFLNGFLGTGGGILLLFGLLFWRKKEGEEGEERDLFATVAAVTAVFSLISSFIYFAKDSFPVGQALKFCLPALVGGAVGAWLLDRVPANVPRKIFSAVTLIAGLLMIFR